ncbi:MAG: type II secretion system F family protein [Pseudomonadota bacterium]
MPFFKYTGLNKAGKKVKGIYETDTVEGVTEYLKKKNIRVETVAEHSGFSFAKLNKINLSKNIPTKDMVIFLRQFSTMIDAGLPLVSCLDVLGSQQKNILFKDTLIDVKKAVESGQTFADALSKHDFAFDSLMVNLIRAGEVGGILDIILQRLAIYVEKSMSLKKKVKSAMTYPMGILIFSGVVVLVLVKFVIPMFQTMFDDLGGELPGITQAVIDISTTVENHILLVIIGIASSITGFKYFKKSPRGRRFFDILYLKLPIVGNVIKKIAIARFARTLGTLMTSGVPILESLEIVSTTAGNSVIQKAIMVVRERVSEGKNMAEPMSESGLFPEMVCQMIKVGEQAGAVDQMLNKIADFYEEEVDEAVGALTSALEPLIMAFLGVVIGTVVVAMYLPVFKMAGGMGE